MFTASLVPSVQHAFMQRPATNYPHANENQQQNSSILFQKRQIDIPEIDKKIADFLPRNEALELRLVSQRLKKNLDSLSPKKRIMGFHSSFRGPNEHCVIPSSNSQIIAYKQIKSVKIDDLRAGEKHHTQIDFAHEISYASFTSDARFFIAASHCSIKIWNIETKLLIEGIIPLGGITFLIKSSNKLLINRIHGGIEIYNLESRETTKILLALADHGGFTTFAETISKNRMVTCSQDQRIRILDLTTKNVIHSFPWNNLYPPASFQIAPDESLMIICSKMGFAEVINLETGTKLHTLVTNTDGHVTSVILSDSKVALTYCNMNSKIKAWDLSTGEELYHFVEHWHPIVSVMLTSDQRIVSCSEDGMIKIWDWKTEKVLHTLTKKGFEILNAIVTFDDLLIIRSSPNEGNQEIITTWDLKKIPLACD